MGVTVGLATVLAEPLREVVEGAVGEWQDVVIAAFTLGVMVVVAVAYVVSRSIVKSLGLLLAGAVFLWGMGNVSWLKDRAGEEFEGGGEVQSLQVDAPAWRAGGGLVG